MHIKPAGLTLGRSLKSESAAGSRDANNKRDGVGRSHPPLRRRATQ